MSLCANCKYWKEKIEIEKNGVLVVYGTCEATNNFIQEKDENETCENYSTK